MNAARRFPTSPSTASPGARRWPPVLAAALVWGAVAMSAAYWGLRWWGEAPTRALPVPPVAPLTIDSGRVAAGLGARVLGAAAPAAVAAPGLSSRLRLLGVVAHGQGQGAALISVDGQPAKPFRVGAVLLDGVSLRSLGPRHAEVGGDGVTARLELPATAAVAAPAQAGFVRP
jgi:general secretion pathway protein C